MYDVHRLRIRERVTRAVTDTGIFEAKKRYGLSVLDYIVTSNHIHLLVKDTGANVIADSMQLIARRSAQEYNQRKGKQGTFWEDRYHATASECEEYLHQCLVYIGLNMVRAGVVNHPSKWVHSGYREIQLPPKRYAVIDLLGLVLRTWKFSKRASQWVDHALENCRALRDDDAGLN